MDDISVLREHWSEVEAPSPGAQERARAALLTRAAQAGGTVVTPARTVGRRRFLPAWAWRSGIATTAAAAAIAAALMVDVGSPGGSGPSGSSPSTSSPSTSTAGGPAGQAIELAATYAAAQPFTPPRSDQWIYLETRFVNSGEMAKSKGGASDLVRKEWRRADGKQTAMINNGRLEVYEAPGGHGFPPPDYPTLAAIPSDPQAVLAWLRKGWEPSANTTDEEMNDTYFNLIATILSQNLPPPEVNAALLRAAGQIPGVTQAETVTVEGRPAIAVGRVGRWLQQALLLAPDTHEFIGHRGVAAKDHTFNVSDGARVDSGRPVTGKAVRIPKGEVQFVTTRITSKIVDAPGRTG